jgi:hypothetical protein
MPLYNYLAQHPSLGGPFHQWMTQQSTLHNAAVVASYDFSGFHTLVDIGGGHGATLTAILAVYPSLHGVLFDRPEVIAQAQLPPTTGVAGRCQLIGGDMIESVPPDGDGYIIKRVLLGEPDDRAQKVLTHCVDVMADEGRVLVIEPVILAGDEPDLSKVLDLHMLVCLGGAHTRTEAEFRQLFAAAGLRLTRIIATSSPNYILEGIRL